MFISIAFGGAVTPTVGRERGVAEAVRGAGGGVERLVRAANAAVLINCVRKGVREGEKQAK